MATVIDAVRQPDRYNGLGDGYRRAQLGVPTGPPGRAPAFRGQNNTPGDAVQAPRILASAARHNRASNVTVPYARVTSGKEINMMGRLSPGDVAFVYRMPHNASDMAKKKPAPYRMDQLAGIDWLNDQLAPGNREKWERGTHYDGINHDDPLKSTSLLSSWTIDGVVMSDDSPGYAASCSEHTRGNRVYNVAVQGPARVNNGCEVRGAHGNGWKSFYDQSPPQVFDRDVQPLSELCIGLVAYELPGEVRGHEDDRYFKYVPFTDRMAWAAGEATNSRKRGREKDFNSLIGKGKIIAMWRIGKVLDTSAARKDSAVNAPQDGTFCLNVNVNVDFLTHQKASNLLGLTASDDAREHDDEKDKRSEKTKSSDTSRQSAAATQGRRSKKIKSSDTARQSAAATRTPEEEAKKNFLELAEKTLPADGKPDYYYEEDGTLPPDAFYEHMAETHKVTHSPVEGWNGDMWPGDAVVVLQELLTFAYYRLKSSPGKDNWILDSSDEVAKELDDDIAMGVNIINNALNDAFRCTMHFTESMDVIETDLYYLRLKVYLRYAVLLAVMGRKAEALCCQFAARLFSTFYDAKSGYVTQLAGVVDGYAYKLLVGQGFIHESLNVMEGGLVDVAEEAAETLQKITRNVTTRLAWVNPGQFSAAPPSIEEAFESQWDVVCLPHAVKAPLRRRDFSDLKLLREIMEAYVYDVLHGKKSVEWELKGLDERSAVGWDLSTAERNGDDDVEFWGDVLGKAIEDILCVMNWVTEATKSIRTAWPRNVDALKQRDEEHLREYLFMQATHSAATMALCCMYGVREETDAEQMVKKKFAEYLQWHSYLYASLANVMQGVVEERQNNDEPDLYYNAHQGTDTNVFSSKGALREDGTEQGGVWKERCFSEIWEWEVQNAAQEILENVETQTKQYAEAKAGATPQGSQSALSSPLTKPPIIKPAGPPASRFMASTGKALGTLGDELLSSVFSPVDQAASVAGAAASSMEAAAAEETRLDEAAGAAGSAKFPRRSRDR